MEKLLEKISGHFRDVIYLKISWHDNRNGIDFQSYFPNIKTVNFSGGNVNFSWRKSMGYTMINYRMDVPFLEIPSVLSEFGNGKAAELIQTRRGNSTYRPHILPYSLTIMGDIGTKLKFKIREYSNLYSGYISMFSDTDTEISVFVSETYLEDVLSEIEDSNIRNITIGIGPHDFSMEKRQMLADRANNRLHHVCHKKVWVLED